jgi:hypothetical protein
MNCILGKPLSHGVFQTTSICCKLTWWPSADLECFKLHGEYYMSAHFIIKTDDDVYVNINGLFRTLLIHGSSLKMSVTGLCEIRDTNPSSKWYVSPKEYSYRCYHGIYMSSSRKNLRYLPVYSLVFSHRILYIHLLNRCMVIDIYL